MKTAGAIKSLAKRHHLVLTSKVPAEDSALSSFSLLTHSGALDKVLTHGLVENLDVVVVQRQLRLKSKGGGKPVATDVFAVSVAHANPFVCLIINPDSLPEVINELISYKMGTTADSTNTKHKIRSSAPIPNEQLDHLNELASQLPEVINLELTDEQLILFTTSLPDSSNLAEQLLRTALQLAS